MLSRLMTVLSPAGKPSTIGLAANNWAERRSLYWAIALKRRLSVMSNEPLANNEMRSCGVSK